MMLLLINVINPGVLLDVPTSYMLKNILHASPSQISLFRFLSVIPPYLAFVFGMVRDPWNPFGQRDRGYFRLFVPVMVCVLAAMALSRRTYSGLLLGMMLTAVAFSFVYADSQGLMALIGQEALMSGRLSALNNAVMFLSLAAAYFASGFMSERLSPHSIFLLVIALTIPLSFFGFWKPRSVFSQAYNSLHAQGSNFFADVRRLLKHRATYPVVLITVLWDFTPGSFTPMQFFLTNQLHAPDATYANFLGLYDLLFLPPALLYGFLCTKFPPRKLLLWSVIVGVPQFIPMAFIHSANQAMAAAVWIGLTGGLATAAITDVAIRACPPGLQGTLMTTIIVSRFMISSRGGDVVGSWLYGLSPTHGFQYCVVAITLTYALILPVIPFIPKRLTATADGEPSPEDEVAVLAEIGDPHDAVHCRFAPQ